MQSRDDPDHVLFNMVSYLDPLEKLVQLVTNWLYQEIVLFAHPTEYERVCTTSCERRDFTFMGINHIVHITYTAYLFPSNESESIAAVKAKCGRAGTTTGAFIYW